jgi:DNA-binding response OmpR family regulator
LIRLEMPDLTRSRSSLAPTRKRILLVDDDPAALRILIEALEEDYELVTAVDGVAGLAAASGQPDLIVTDVDMPRLDGIAMTRHIRERLGLRVPVIFLTAMDSPRHVIAGIAVGARHYMTKPVNLAQLEQRIARALGLHSVHSEPPRR